MDARSILADYRLLALLLGQVECSSSGHFTPSSLESGDTYAEGSNTFERGEPIPKCRHGQQQ